jgi:hypothetical protein
MEHTTCASYRSSQVADCGRLPDDRAPHLLEIKGLNVMHKIMFAAALAVGLITAPMPQFISTAGAQQQASAPDKNAKPKKEQSPGQVAARERQKKCAAEWKEQKAAGKIEKGATWPKYWSDCNKRLKAAAK